MYYNNYEQLPYETRLRKIGELLAKGVTLMLANEKKKEDALITPKRSISDLHLSKPLSDMLEYIVRCKSVSPKEVRCYFSLTRRTAYRRLKALLDAGLVKRTGCTNACRYIAI